MNYLKKMNSAIRTEAAGKGMIWGAVIAVLLNVIMMMTGYGTGYVMPVMTTLLTGFLSAVIAVLMSLRRTGALTKRVRSLERISGRISDDRITPVSENVSMGSTWLVHQDGTKFRVWTRDMLKNIEIESQNPQAKKAVLKLITSGGRTDKCVAAKSAELEAAVRNWFAPAEEADNLTFGQM
jgi:hypothetical protein